MLDSIVRGFYLSFKQCVARLIRGLGVLCLLAALATTARASILLQVFGQPGSSEIVLELSGSHVLTGVSSTSSAASLMRLPVSQSGGNWWVPASWGGEELWSSVITTSFFNATSSTMTQTITGDIQQTFNFDGISIASDGDGMLVPFTFTPASGYPSLSGADITITVSGAATFDLPDGMLFDDLNVGTRTSDYSYYFPVTQTVTAVPEPASFAFLVGLAVISFGTLRRRRSTHFGIFGRTRTVMKST